MSPELNGAPEVFSAGEPCPEASGWRHPALLLAAAHLGRPRGRAGPPGRSPGDTSQCTFSRQLTAAGALGSVPVLKTPVRPLPGSGKDGGGHEPWKAGGTCPACGTWVSPSRGFWPLLVDPPFRHSRVAYRREAMTKGSRSCRPPTDRARHGQHHRTGQHLMDEASGLLDVRGSPAEGLTLPAPPQGCQGSV